MHYLTDGSDVCHVEIVRIGITHPLFNSFIANNLHTYCTKSGRRVSVPQRGQDALSRAFYNCGAIRV